MSVKVNEVKIVITGIDDLLDEIAGQTVADIKSNAPKDTGTYVNGIISKKTDEQERTIFNDGLHAPLGHVLEYGTVHQKAQPHYKPAFDKNAKEFEKKAAKLKLENKK